MIQKCTANKVKQARYFLLSSHLFLKNDKHTSSYIGPVILRPHDVLSGIRSLTNGINVEKTEHDELPFDLN